MIRSPLRSRKKSQGFTLIEVMIASGVGVFIMLTLAQLVISGFKGQKGVEAASDLNEVSALLQQILSQPDTCQSILQGLVINVSSAQVGVIQSPAGFTEIDYPKANPAFPGTPGASRLIKDSANKLITTVSTDPKNKWKNWTVSSLGVILNSAAPLSVSPYLYSVKIAVGFKKSVVGQSYGGDKGSRQVSSLMVSTSAPVGGLAAVTGCAGVETVGQRFCESVYLSPVNAHRAQIPVPSSWTKNDCYNFTVSRQGGASSTQTTLICLFPNGNHFEVGYSPGSLSLPNPNCGW